MEAMFNTKNKNKGQILVLAAISLVVFIGFLALAIDLAYFFHTRHQLQGAADSAALAGASFLTCQNDTGNVFLNQTTARRMAWQLACKNKAAQKGVFLVMSSSCNNPPSGADLNNATNDANGDIIVGFWNVTSFHRADGTTGNRINAVKVVARREEGKDYTGGGVVRFFGGIFQQNRQDITTRAIARGCFVNLSPISVNEYWMGEQPISVGGDCNKVTFSNPLSGKRNPYGINHVYPNSFVRPPCIEPGEGTSGSCKTPSNGNVFNNYTFPSFKTKDCNGNNITVTTNGPRPSSFTAYTGIARYGRPDDGGDPTATRAGRVFAIVGGAAHNNDNSQMYSLIGLDYRTTSSKITGSPWYKVPGYTPIASASATNPDKDVIASYIAAGRYPNDPPGSVNEVYQPGYITTTEYLSYLPPKEPTLASVSFPSGQGVAGQMVKNNFYDNKNYSNHKYDPGKKIVVAVYDGIVGSKGNMDRTTIVGFSRITICGYGSKLNTKDIYPVRCQDVDPSTPHISGTANTMYGYVANTDDSLKPNLDTFFEPGGHSILVK